MDLTSMATFWATVGLVLFLALAVYLKVPTMLAKSLDERADKITNELKEAKRLREEAQALLVEYQRKRKDAETEAAQIVAAAEREAEMLTAEAKQKTDEFVARRTALSEQKIAQAESDAITAVRSAAVDLAVAAAESVIAAKSDAAVQNKLFSQATQRRQGAPELSGLSDTIERGRLLPAFFYGLARARLGGRSFLPQRPKAHAVQRAGAMHVDGGTVFRRCIACVKTKPIGREGQMGARHHPVAGDLGDDRGGRDRDRAGVTLDDRLAGANQAGRNVAAISQHHLRPHRQSVHGPSHGIEARLADIRGVDRGRTGGGDSDGCRGHDLVEQAFPLGGRQLLAVVQPFRNAVGIENDGCSNHRTRQGAAAGLVCSGDRPEALAPCSHLKAEVRGDNCFEKKRGIGRCAS